MNTFDKHCAGLLNACGYRETRYPASWSDCGDAESGPCLEGGPAYAVWAHREAAPDELEYDMVHDIIVERGVVVYDGSYPDFGS